MKAKILSVLILILIFFTFVFSFRNVEIETNNQYKILKVKSADEYYIDYNNNGKIDLNELFKLKNVTALYPYKNYKTNNILKTTSLNLDEYLITGFIAQRWAIDNLQDKYVEILNPEQSLFSNVIYADIKYQDMNVAEFLLKSGLAVLYKNNKNIDYIRYENLSQIRNNAKALKDKNFVLLNEKNNIYHKLNCKFAKMVSNGEIILLKNAHNAIPCKVCIDNKPKYDIPKEFKNLIPNSKKIYKKSIYKNFSGLELYLINPYVYNKPNSSCVTDICKRLVNEINSSNKSIDVALYEISGQKDILDALISAKKRGVNVRTVLDNSKKNPEFDSTVRDIFINYFSPSQDSFSSIMHNKFMIFDNKKVFTGSINISSTGTGGYNANIASIINSCEIAQIYKQEFENMFNNLFSKNKDLIVSKPVNIDKSTVSVYFSPKSDIYNNVISNKIKQAKSEIFVSIFYLTDKNLINELINAKNRGVNVLILMDSLGAINFKEKIKTLRKAKIPVIVENWGGKNHEKTILIDSKTLIFGSCNFSNSGFNKNDENVVVVENPDIALFYRDYYLYLFNSIDKKFLKLFPRAEGLDSINSCHDGIDNNFDGKIDFDDLGCHK